MTSRLHPTSSRYLHLLGRLMHQQGCSTLAWLKRGDLGPDALEKPTLELSAARFGALLEDARQTLDSPELGLRLGQALVPTTHGALGFAVVNGATLRQVLSAIERFIGLRLGLLRARVVQSEETCTLELSLAEPVGPSEDILMVAALLSIHQALHHVGRTSSVRRVLLKGPAPSWSQDARRVFGTPLRFNQPAWGLCLSARELDTPLQQADLAAWSLAEQACERELAERLAGCDVSVRVRSVLGAQERGFPSLEHVARTLGMSSRTLHRQLRAEGSSFREILEGLRRERARRLLLAGELSVGEIAFELGYSNRANFARAFRRWEGCAPGEFRG